MCAVTYCDFISHMCDLDNVSRKKQSDICMYKNKDIIGIRDVMAR